VVLDGGTPSSEYAVEMSSPRGASWDVRITNRTVEGLEVVWSESSCTTATESLYLLDTVDRTSIVAVPVGETINAVVFPVPLRTAVEEGNEGKPGEWIRGARCNLVMRAGDRALSWDGRAPRVEVERNYGGRSPSYSGGSSNGSSGGCKKGCACGNSCIDCSKTCRGGETYRKRKRR